MSKKHQSSGNDSGRRGRPERPTGGSGFFQKFSGPRKDDGRPSGGNPRFGGGADRERSGGAAGRGGEFSSRPTFGRGTGERAGGFGGPKKFGTGGGFNKFGSGSNAGRSTEGGSYRGRDSRENEGRRPYGNRPEGGAGRSFDRSAPRRDDDRRRDDRRSFDDRPAQPFTPKKTWEGQPYRQDGKPTVPRGTAGERNRKFVKADPNADNTAGSYQRRETPAFDRDRERRPTEQSTGADREIRPARPFDFRGRPDELDDERPTRSFRESRESSFGRSSGERSGAGNRSFGERREGGFGNRQEGGFDKRRDAGRGFGDQQRPSRPYGERENRSSDARTERPARPTDKRFGRDAATPNRADKMKFGEVAGQAPDYKNLKHYEADKNRGNKRRREEDEQGEELRLNRYIANAGVCSRREADALIAAGEIKVNGEVVTEMGYKVQPTDTVQYGKTNLNREKLVYVLLNKPKDTITTTEDPEGRRTVMDLVKESSKERIFPVGRLDRNTTGLLLFTNDGEVAQKLSHPSHRNKKIYQVELDKPLTEAHLRQIAEGVELEDGKAEVDDVAIVAGNAHFVGIEIHIGRNRIVRRIFEHLGYDVVTLDRVQYAGLTKKDLPRGKWRFLNEKEVIRLKYFM